MSPRTHFSRIQDMLRSCENILNYKNGLDMNAFNSDQKTIRAVAYELIMIGEAARTMPEEIKLIHTDIPWDNIQGIRNILVHEYFRLDEEILWVTITEDIPKLVVGLKAIESDNR